jgi:hypothetical protein
VNETFVLLINISGESPALRVAAKRYASALTDKQQKNIKHKNYERNGFD